MKGNMKKKSNLSEVSLARFAPLASFNTSVEALVVQTLRTAVTSGAFYPGQEIDEAAIAKDLGISRMPVRQAIPILEHEGLITKIPRKGIFVTKLDSQDIEEIYTTRVALEEVVIKAAIPRYTQDNLTKIKDNIIKLEACVNTTENISEKEAYLHFLEVDKEFNNLLYTPSGWNRATKYISQLRNNTAMYRLLCASFPKEKQRKSLEDHKNIFNACVERDMEKACKLLREHTLTTAPLEELSHITEISNGSTRN